MNVSDSVNRIVFFRFRFLTGFTSSFLTKLCYENHSLVHFENLISSPFLILLFTVIVVVTGFFLFSFVFFCFLHSRHTVIEMGENEKEKKNQIMHFYFFTFGWNRKRDVTENTAVWNQRILGRINVVPLYV